MEVLELKNKMSEVMYVLSKSRLEPSEKTRELEHI